MKLLLYGLNYAPEVTGIGKYSGEMCEWLLGSNTNNEIKVVTAPPYYPAWEVSSEYKNWFGVESLNGVDVYRAPLFVPKSPTTLTRILHLLSFSLSSLVQLTKLVSWRPHVVVNVVPTLFTTFNAWVFSRLTGSKLIVHIQDFEGDAMFGLGMAQKGLLPKIWNRLELFLLRRADMVSTISNAMIANAHKKGIEPSKTCLIPNWSELDRFQNVNESHVIKLRENLAIPFEKKVILYSGNIGKKQGLGLILDLAELKKDQDDWVFVIVGEGAAKNELVDLAEVRELKNVLFYPLQPYESLPALLSLADVHLVIQSPGVADAVLPSKLTNILAVGGNAVITTHEKTEMGLMAAKFKGICVAVKPEDSESLLTGIEHALKMKRPNQIAIEYSQKNLSKNQILKKFETTVLSLIN